MLLPVRIVLLVLALARQQPVEPAHTVVPEPIINATTEAVLMEQREIPVQPLVDAVPVIVTLMPMEIVTLLPRVPKNARLRPN